MSGSGSGSGSVTGTSGSASGSSVGSSGSVSSAGASNSGASGSPRSGRTGRSSAGSSSAGSSVWTSPHAAKRGAVPRRSAREQAVKAKSLFIGLPSFCVSRGMIISEKYTVTQQKGAGELLEGAPKNGS